jgi:hypothetical protein
VPDKNERSTIGMPAKEAGNTRSPFVRIETKRLLKKSGMHAPNTHATNAAP